MFDSYKDISICESGEPLVSLSAISKKIKVYPYYFQHHVPGASNECYLRKGVAERLLKATEFLPSNIHLVVLDGWRSYQTQLALYNRAKNMFLQKGYSSSKIVEELSKYVSFPSKDYRSPSPHLTGGAVDVTLADERGWLNMGTDFDEFHEKSRANWFETKDNLTEEEKIIRENRRLLKDIMEKAGFTSNEYEWWHFDYGNQSWALKTNQIPIYSIIENLP